MPRCITSTSPDERSANRYLALRPSPLTVWPLSRCTKSFGSGQRRSPRWATTSTKRAPSMTGASPRRTVSTSGSSGIQALTMVVVPGGIAKSSPSAIPARFIAPHVRSRYRLPAGVMMAKATERQADFGFRQVPLGDKQALVDDVFHSVARRYDLMNDLMSLGMHRAWKDALVTAVHPPRGERAFRLLDVAGGTGDIALRVVDAGGVDTSAVVVDINAEMLKVGRERAYDRARDDVVTFVEGNAEALPFPDRSFDAVTIAFGIRNVPRIDAALKEAHRVLRIGGRFLCLEFSTVDVPGLDALYDFFSFNGIPALGRAVTDDADAYRYLVESIRRFPRPEAFAEMMRDAGFARVSFQRMTGGIVALHSGWRL